MIRGLLLRGVTHPQIERAVLPLQGGVVAVWMTYSIDDLLESVEETDVFDRRALQTESFAVAQPSQSGACPVPVVMASGVEPLAVRFLVRAAHSVLAAANLDREAMKSFLAEMCWGRIVDLRWFAQNAWRVAGLADWTIWRGLPEPMEEDGNSLALARSPAALAALKAALLEALLNPLSWRSGAGTGSVFEIDVEPMLIGNAPHYDGSVLIDD
ncbi:hypothetical protein [Tahibacter amnicola]|uniref:Uncharacterized protein n=1 Tax=Tahibacter amnicola TaxID=2976241 RepID=A0ABY6BL63_9GAMM|nr:hypothetical protein [Tahibacter amnicola]UXI70366.1 hypothetical protein N4264_12250 [Tahibacter amnicola]